VRHRDGSDIFGAVDLGSNSFHLLIARVVRGRLEPIEHLRETVRLAAGLDSHDQLDAASRGRALECLRRFGKRLRMARAGRVRVVGTGTLRRARGCRSFREQAAEALGYPIEIISGTEEARLIWVGAVGSLPRVRVPRIVVDIGGGSTEIIRGRGLSAETLESIDIGCVGLSAHAFPGGRLSARNFARARAAARRALEPVRAHFEPGSARAVGTSGTIRAAHTVLRALGRARSGLTARDVETLIAEMIAAGTVRRLSLPGLPAERATVFPGGVAILAEVLAVLGLGRMTLAGGALREGLLRDMAGLSGRSAPRRQTTQRMRAG
jgi:exopolyphosphatase/guanosine-5'-triphosphate,3'-diphosphate pyrophosphatase